MQDPADSSKKRLPHIKIKTKVPIYAGILILLVAAGLVSYKVLHKHQAFPVVIGGTKITKQDVTSYAAEIKAYERPNSSTNFGGSPSQVAVDDLVLNAALKSEAQKLKKPLTDADIINASYETLTTAAQKSAYLSQFHSGNKMQQTRAENIAYEQKFDNTLIAKKNLMVAGINFDTPYFDQAPKDQVQARYDQAKARLQNTIMPLLQKKASDNEISQHVDLTFKNITLTKGTDNYQQYFQKAVLDMQIKTDYTSGQPLFNDQNNTSYIRGNVGKLYSTDAKIDSLKKVGDYTNVFASKAGVFMVIRLDSETGGSYSSWSDFLAHYKQQYGLTTVSLTKQLGTKVSSSLNTVVQSLASIGESEANADVLLPNGSYCSQHNVQFTGRSWDEAVNAPIGGQGTTFQESRPISGEPCPDTLDGSQQATTGGANNTLNDNCFAVAPSWAVISQPGAPYTAVPGGPYPVTPANTGANYAGYNVTWDNNGVAIRSGPGSDKDDARNGDGWPAWNSSAINETGHIYIIFLYKGCTTCTCKSDCPPNNSPTQISCTSFETDTPPSGDYETYWITDSSGNTEQGYTNTAVNGRASGSVTPLGQVITLNAYAVDSHGNHGTTHSWSTTGNCFGASCSMYVDGNLPDGGVLAGSNFNVTVTFYNTGQVDLPSSLPKSGGNINLDLTTNPSTGGPAAGGTVPAGGAYTFTFGAVAPGTTGPMSFSGYPDYFTDFGLGGSCSTSVNVETRAASCTIDSIDGPITGGYVQAGKPFTVNATITNTGTAELATTDGGNPLSLNYGDNGGANSHWTFPDNNLDVSLFPGQSTQVSFTLPAPLPYLPNPADSSTQPANGTLWAHVAYSNDFALGAQCTSTIDMYVPFNLTGGGSASPLPNGEDPTSFDYKTWVDSNAPVSVDIPTADGTAANKVYEKPAAGPTKTLVPTYDTNGPFAPTTAPNHDYILTGNTATTPPTMAGDTYYAEVDLPFTSAYIGANGPDDVVAPTTPQNFPGDFVVKNRPFFKAYDSGISTGGAFQQVNASCSGGGELAGWNNDTGTYPTITSSDYGASAQLNTLALTKIVGVGSGQAAFSNSPTNLAFANTNAADITGDTDSPGLGGAFDPGAGGYCLNDQTLPTSGDVATGSGQYSLDNGGALGIANSDNKSIFVTGDVYIANNVLYNTSGWSYNVGDSNVPSFVLHATGNIYIGHNVTELDGLYIARGEIYTCSDDIDGQDFSPMPHGQPGLSHDMFNTCNKQLSVNGSFVASQVNMMRTFGSLRDETPVPNTVPLAAGEALPGMDSKRPAQYVHVCQTSSGTTYVTQGSPDCLAGDTWQQDYGPSVARTFYSIPCASLSGAQARYIYISSSDSCPDGAYARATFTTSGSNVTVTSLPTEADLAALNSGTGCSNNGGGWLSKQTCAGEVFEFSPELYLSSPNVAPPSNGAPQWDAVTSLPPVL